MSMVRAHVVVQGKVQGVYYRVCTQNQALLLELTGWVRNCPDGSVEVIIEGDRERVEELTAWCKKGPAESAVSDLSVDWQPYTGEFNDFDIAPTKV